MQYLGYILILLAVYAGYASWPSYVIIAFAFAAVILFMGDRRRELKGSQHHQSTNMFLEGGYLFFGQGLIMFTAYALGWFLANRVQVPTP